MRLDSIGFIVWGKQYEFDGVICCFRAVVTKNHGIVPFFATSLAIEIDDDEVPFHRARVKALPIGFQWFAEGHGVFQNKVDFLLYQLFNRGMLY